MSTRRAIERCNMAWLSFVKAVYKAKKFTRRRNSGQTPVCPSELSQAEEELLAQIFDQYGHWNRWKIVAFLHTLPEWQDPNGSAIPISYRDILAAGQKTPAEISIVEEELESRSAVENILA
jgi:hypothetical protein